MFKRNKKIKERKLEIVNYGQKIVAVIEAICLPQLDGKALEFCQLHRRCQDYFDHPHWEEYEKLVLKLKKIMEG